MRLLLLTATIASGIHFTAGYNALLMVANIPSHLNMYIPLIRSLLSNGHQATLIIGENAKVMPYNTTGIKILKYKMTKDSFLFANDSAVMRKILRLQSWWELFSFTFSDEGLVNLIEEHKDLFRDAALLTQLDSEGYDIAFVDGDILSHAAIPYRLGIPFVIYGYYCEAVSLRIPEPSSFVPKEFWAVSTSELLTFQERTVNFLVSIFEELFYEFTENSDMETVATGAPNRQPISVVQAVRRAKVCFKLKDEILEYPKPTMPFVVSLTGFTIEKSKRLDHKELEVILSSSSMGVIVAVLGTLADKLDDDKTQLLLKAFGKLPVPVIFRISTTFKNIPKNVHLFKWLPQNDLFADKRVKAVFIHGGAASALEAIYHAKPMVIYPLFIDQLTHAGMIEERGYGIALNRFTATSDDVIDALQRVTHDDSYRVNVERASKRLKVKASAAEAKLYQYLDYVIEGGAEHLSSRAMKMSLKSYYNLDVIATLFVLVEVLIVTLGCIICKIFNKLCH